MQKQQRAAQRFPLKLPVIVRWARGAATREARTESKDVSSRGVYFFLPKGVKRGSPVELVLTLPHEVTGAGPVTVRCRARIQRTEPREAGKVGVVAAIEHFEFLRGDDQAA